MSTAAVDPLSQTPLAFVEINGARLAYRIAGNPSDPLIITLHGGRGFGSHKNDFRVHAPLTDRFRVLSFDYRGHGESSRTKPYTFKQLVDDIEGIKRHFEGNKRVIIHGGSFGGFLAQQYALTYPDSLSHLVLRGTAPSHHHEAEAFENLKTRAAKRAPMATVSMLRKGFSAYTDDNEMRVALFAKGPLYVDTDYDPDKALEANRRTIFNAESHNDLYSEQEKYFDYRSRLHEIAIPTLIIVGENDWICPPTQSKLISEGIKGSKLVVVPGANHSVSHEQPELFIATIREFIGRRAAKSGQSSVEDSS